MSTVPVVWKIIPGFENYEASSHGRIRRAAGGRGARKGHVLAQHPAGKYGHTDSQETAP